tara:strand:- start:100 stop:1242 length:1143 start_codon:yes stop_codon:yes gene_type:complete
MNNRILKRPMFRMGGRSDDGIMSVRPGFKRGTSLLTDPQLYLEAEKLKQKPFLSNKKIEDKYQDAIESADLSVDFSDVEGGLRLPGSFQQKEIAKAEFLKTPEGEAFFKKPLLEQQSKEIEEREALGVPIPDNTINLSSDLEEDQDSSITLKGKPVSADDTETQKLSDNDLKTMYQDLLPLFKSELSADEDELKRQKYLELAKFGANLLAQPGGNLIGAIGKAGASSLEGLSRIAETKRKTDAGAKAMALEAALKQADPGTIMKQVRDIMRLDPSLTQKEALAKVLSTGSATKGRTKQSRIDNYATDLIESDYVTDKKSAKSAAEAIEESGLGIGVFQKDPGSDYAPGAFYIFKNGKVGKYIGKDKNGKDDFAEPGDDNF